MSYIQVRDVLDNMALVHERLQLHYDEQAALTTNASVQEALRHAADRAERAALLFDSTSTDQGLNRWLQFDPTQDAVSRLSAVRIDNRRGAERVMRDLLSVEELILAALTRLAEQGMTERLAHLLGRVRDLQATRTRQLAFALASLTQGGPNREDSPPMRRNNREDSPPVSPR